MTKHTSVEHLPRAQAMVMRTICRDGDPWTVEEVDSFTPTFLRRPELEEALAQLQNIGYIAQAGKHRVTLSPLWDCTCALQPVQ